MNYTVYQVKRDDSEGRLFMNNDWLNRHGLRVHVSAYDRIYSGPAVFTDGAEEFLECLWTRFNINCPSDFKGHSMSVSDVIVLEEGGITKAFFCDSFGWVEVPEFFKPGISLVRVASLPQQCGGCDGAETEKIECLLYEIFTGRKEGDLYLPVTPRGCVFWIRQGETEAECIPIRPDGRGIPTVTVNDQLLYVAELGEGVNNVL